MKLAKQKYYNILNEPKKSQKLWQVVNALAFNKICTRLLQLITTNGHTVIDEESIAEEFNNYFVNIGKIMVNVNTPTLACNLNFTATNKNSNLLFLTPSCSSEVFNVMKKPNTKKLVKFWTSKRCLLNTLIQ